VVWTGFIWLKIRTSGELLSRSATGGFSRRIQLHGVSYMQLIIAMPFPYIERVIFYVPCAVTKCISLVIRFVTVCKEIL
jgi:hypothetical protein